MSKKKYVIRLEPTFIDKDKELRVAKNLNGPLWDSSDQPRGADIAFDQVPILEDVLCGDDKLGPYLQIGADKTKTKYYLANSRNGLSHYLVCEDGLFYTLRRDLYAYSDFATKTAYYEVVLFAVYVCAQNHATSTRRAPGGLIEIGDMRSRIAKPDPHLPGSRVKVEMYNIQFVDNLSEDVPSKYTLGTMSFVCFSRFFSPDPNASWMEFDDVRHVLTGLMSGRFLIQDIEQDETIDLRITDKNAKRDTRKAYSESNLQFHKNLYPDTLRALIPSGFVPISSSCTKNSKIPLTVTCHKSGGVLLEDTVNNTQYVMGVDEGSYFASELPKGELYSSAQDALLALAPKEAREHPQRKLSELKAGVSRQGEWFAVPENGVNTILHPAYHSDKVVEFEEIILPRDHGEAERHTLLVNPTDALIPASYKEGGRWSSGWVSRLTGRVYVQEGKLGHPDHGDLILDIADYAGTGEDPGEMAYAFYHNRAVRSFSAGGVD